jgi:hypothetical protein
MTTFIHRCQLRNCKHYQSINENGLPVCNAFPFGIPNEISDGSNYHTKSLGNDDGITYTPNNSKKQIVVVSRGKRNVS